MPGIFVSYRRQDSSGWAGNLARALAEEFGKDKVFFDIATLEPGVDYAEAIERRIALANVLLIVIGPQWLTAVDKNEQRRLDDPTDLVRLEVAAALKRNIPVVPVLVGGAAMPSASDLPEELQSLARRNAYELSDRRWIYDLGELIKHLRKVITPPPFRLTRTYISILMACLLVPVVIVAYYTADTILETGKRLLKSFIEQTEEAGGQLGNPVALALQRDALFSAIDRLDDETAKRVAVAPPTPIDQTMQNVVSAIDPNNQRGANGEIALRVLKGWVPALPPESYASWVVALGFDKGEALQNFVCRGDPDCANPYTTRFEVIKACWPEGGVPADTFMLDFVFQDAFAEQRRAVAACLGL